MFELPTEELFTWDILKLYAYCYYLHDNGLIEDEDKNHIEWGSPIARKGKESIRIPIWYLVNEEWYEYNPNKAIVHVKGYGMFDLWDFEHEKMQRESFMRKKIIENMQDGKPTESRVKM